MTTDSVRQAAETLLRRRTEAGLPEFVEDEDVLDAVARVARPSHAQRPATLGGSLPPSSNRVNPRPHLLTPASVQKGGCRGKS